ncbi:MAG: hypothetical protein L6Q92_10800 [Phycisphaerae bacterium]|nr:hypothetical protein [Phycisphaerae bacterium]
MAESPSDGPVTLEYARPRVGRFERLRQSAADPRAERPRLRRWAIVTLLTYLVALLVLYVPLLIICFWSPMSPFPWDDVINSFAAWPFWLIIAILLAAQALMLLVPVRASWDYEIKPRHLLVPIVTTCTLFALLAVGMLFSWVLVLFRDGLSDWVWLLMSAVFIGTWIGWWIAFARIRRAGADEVVSQTQQSLVRGSIIELLVAVSCHIWVRQRGDCSAPIVTFIAICAGVAVMLCAFGPGVFHLYVARARRMQATSARHADA